jgi:PAS domain-containing protein
MFNIIDYTIVGIFIKNNKSFFSQTILDIFESDKNTIENKLFEITEIKNFLSSNHKEISFKKTIKLNNKTKKLKFILYKNKNSIYIIVTDCTNVYNSFIISKTLSKLIKLIRIKEENELFKKTVELILNEAEFAATFIMINQNNILKPVAWGNKLDDNLECIKSVEIPLNIPNPALNTPIAKAFLKGKIFINNNTFTNPDVEVLREEMLKRNYLSSVGIPIFKNNKPYGTICICHYEINFFGKFKELLKEISNIISYVLDAIEENKFTNIIKMAIDTSHEWIIITDKSGKILYVNDIVK